MQLFEFLIGGDVWARDWGATYPKRGTNKTRPQTLDPTRSDAIWRTAGWRCYEDTKVAMELHPTAWDLGSWPDAEPATNPRNRGDYHDLAS
jgi:hypothetical protein